MTCNKHARVKVIQRLLNSISSLAVELPIYGYLCCLRFPSWFFLDPGFGLLELFQSRNLQILIKRVTRFETAIISGFRFKDSKMWVSECYFKEPLCGKKNDFVAPMPRNAHIKLEPRVLHITHSSLSD